MNYNNDSINYILNTQKIFSGTLFIFYTIYTILINLLDIIMYKKANPTLIVSLIEIILFLTMYLIFSKYNFKSKKQIIILAYFNIIQTVFLLEILYFFYDNYVSYAIIFCITLSTSFTIIDTKGFYTLIIITIFTFDTIFLLNDNIETYVLIRSIIDNIILMFFSGIINWYISNMKIKDFEINSKLKRISEIDPLTKLLNRNSAEKFINKYSNTNIYSVMIIIDLDNFKLANDKLGHMKGDEILIEISNRLRSIFRTGDCVSRLGGDEFLIFLPNVTDKNFINIKLQQILNIFPLDSLKNTKDIPLSCSIGAIFSDCNIPDLYNTLYKLADEAMYEAKNNGKNNIIIKSRN